MRLPQTLTSTILAFLIVVAITTPAVAEPMTLSQAVEVGTLANPSVLGAREAAIAAGARVDQAKAQTRFTLSFNSAGSVSSADVGQPPPDHETFAAVQNSVTVPIPLGHKTHLAVEQADAQAEEAEQQYRSAVTALTNQIVEDYFDLLKKQAAMRDAGDALTASQDLMAQAHRRNALGDVPELDVLRAQVQVSAANGTLTQAQNAADIAEETLNAALGRPIDTELVLVDSVDVPDVPPYSESDACARAVHASPDVLAAQQSMVAAEFARTSARLWQEPSLSIQAIDARTGDVTSLTRVDTLQASVTVPLDDGGLAQGQEKETAALLDQAGANVDTARLTAEAAAGAAYRNAVSARLQAQSAREALDIAVTANDKTVRGYQDGLFTLTDVLNAGQTLAQARSAYTQSRYDAQAATALLKVAVGESQLEKE